MTTAENKTNDSRIPTALRWAGLLIILCIAAMRMVTAFGHIVVFDVDPALDPNPLAGLAAGSLWLDVLLLLGSGLALLGHCLARCQLDWIIIVAALLPMFVVFSHGIDDLGDLRKGATWAAAVIAGVTIAHLRHDAAMRIVIIMILAGVLGPLVVRGAANVTYEYDDTLQLYNQQEQLILADKGWAEDSASAKIYRRRLEQRQPTGWFVTTNIFGSFMGAGIVLWIGLGIAAVLARLTSGWTGLCVLCAGVCATGLWMTESKGAILSCAAGIGALIILVYAALRIGVISNRVMKFAPLLGIGLVVGALVGIVFRGAVLPESFAGEVSLLYRWHYIVSAVHVFVENVWLGVGPDEFQAQYMLHRIPRNPEEVASAHSIFFDWLATLGVLSVAWIGLMAALLWRAGKLCNIPTTEEQIESKALCISPAAALGATACVALLGVGLAIVWERHVLDMFSALIRIIGVMGFVVFALVAGHIAARADRRILDITLFASAIVLVVHGQIEMTWTQPGSVVMAWVILGAASPAFGNTKQLFGIVGSVTLLCAAGWLGLTGAVPAMRLENRTVAAARLLWPAAEARQMQLLVDASQNTNSANNISVFIERRNKGLTELGIDPPADALRWTELEAMLKPVLIDRRVQAADILEQAYRDWPVSEDGLSMASRQLSLASNDMKMPKRLDVLQRSVDLGEESASLFNDISSASLAIFGRLRLYELTGIRAHMDRAIELAEYITTRDPNGVRAWVTLGNVLWRDDQLQRAAEAYRRALLHSDNFELDEDKQLDVDDRKLYESRIAEAELR